MRKAFEPIALEEYAKLHAQANSDTSVEEITASLRDALKAHRRGIRCQCGNPIWVIGSAVAGYACFTCITGEATPDDDCEIDEALATPNDSDA